MQVGLRKRATAAIAVMLGGAEEARFADVDEVAGMFSAALAGASRLVLESGTTRVAIERPRGKLRLMCEAYVRAAAV